MAALAGLRAPVVWVLLAIAFFTSISGKPVDGVLMLIVAVGLAWDAGRGGVTTASAHPVAVPPLSVPRFWACRSSGPGAARLTQPS